MKVNLMLGDCLERMKEIPGGSVDSIVTDPPYGLGFMGKHWDKGVPSAEIWAEALRVLKPGGHLLAFAGTRTQHRMAVNIEDAGFEIRDMIAWVYGSGFPKSLDVSKAIDKAAGAEREVVGTRKKLDSYGQQAGNNVYGGGPNHDGLQAITAPATEAAKQWDGWGTALKPALEPITVARKPFKGTVAANVLAYGAGALNIDGCRVGIDPSVDDPRLGGAGTWVSTKQGSGRTVSLPPATQTSSKLGRWPANLIHDGSDEVLGLFPHTTSGALNAGHKQGAGSFGKIGGETVSRDYGNDKGSAARFFYCAKSSKKDRGEDNKHPTVKPTDLMRYLCRLVTPPNGIVLDPFMGSGSTGKAAMLEGFRFIGIELDQGYFDIAKQRIESAK